MKRRSRLRIDEAIAIERPDVCFRGLAGVAEDQLEVRIGGDRGGRLGADRPDVDALVDGFEQPREGRGASIHERPNLEPRPLSGRRARQPCGGCRRRHVRARSVGPELLVDGRADVADRGARPIHLPRPVRDVDADGALDAVFVPLDHVAVLGALLHEAVVVAAVARALASAEAGHVAQDLGVLGGELVRRGHDFRRARRSISLKWNRRQGRVLARPEAGGCRGTGDGPRVGLRRLRRGWRSGLVSSAAQDESQPTPTTATRMAPPIHGLNPLDALAVLSPPCPLAREHSVIVSSCPYVAYAGRHRVDTEIRVASSGPATRRIACLNDPPSIGDSVDCRLP